MAGNEVQNESEADGELEEAEAKGKPRVLLLISTPVIMQIYSECILLPIEQVISYTVSYRRQEKGPYGRPYHMGIRQSLEAVYSPCYKLSSHTYLHSFTCPRNVCTAYSAASLGWYSSQCPGNNLCAIPIWICHHAHIALGNATSLCPSSAPCCSDYGFCGTGSVRSPFLITLFSPHSRLVLPRRM